MSVMSPIVCCSRFLTILFTVMSASAATVPCVDNFASCSQWTDVCDDQVAAIHICPSTCGKCEQYNDLPRPSCQNKVDTYFCELAADCAAPLHVTLCPLTCGQCELVTSQTSTVTGSSTTASSTTASTTSPSTSAFTRASTHTSAHDISTRPATASTMSEKSSVVIESTMTSTHSTTNNRSTMPATASTMSEKSSVVTESTTLAMTSTHSTTNKRSTMPTTTTTQLRSSACIQCGDLDRGVPCTDEETLLAQSSQCEDDRPYCMNDIIQTSGLVTIYKRCVNETVCNTEWYMESSDKQQCTQYDPAIYTDDLVCHLCCYGDDCNADNVPQAGALYKP